MKIRTVCLLLLATTGCAPLFGGSRPQPSQSPQRAAGGAPSAAGDSAGGRPGGVRARPYAQVITREAVTREGLFKTHQIGSRLYFEIPRSELGKDMLLVTQIRANTLGEGYGGEPVGNRLLRWERRDNRILLRSPSYQIVADSARAIFQGVQAANYAPVLAAFDVESWGADSAAVIDVTSLYTAPPPEMGLGNQIRGNIDRARTFVERALSFPTNVNVEATHTYNVTPQTPGGGGPGGGGGGGQAQPRTASVLVHWSMVRLPDTPMMPRLFDDRVGYFSFSRQDFGTDEHRMAQRTYVRRWRLECAEGQSTPCEPVKPITYYIDPATPENMVEWVRKGIEDWQVAFEEAGFRNAIVAKDAPSPQEDPFWSPEDARYSVVRWLPSNIENANGPSISDPRSGEIIEADINMYHNVQNLLRNWYFVQVAHLDPRVRRLPMPDSLMGRLVQFVVAHEVGHTLGFQHNQKGSSMYPADSVRSVTWVEKMGHSPSIMDYSRFNYVAQPEDGIPLDKLIPDIGPYDKWATMWGYKPIPGATTPEAELATLDSWARRQDNEPWLRFVTSDSKQADISDHTEAVGDADAVASTRLGVKNIRRIVPMLIPATENPGRDFADLLELYERLIGQWRTELGHVVNVVGGVESQEKYWGQEGVRFLPVQRARQVAAVQLLNEEAFRTPSFFLDQEILRRVEVDGALTRIGAAQNSLLNALFSNARLGRMTEFEALALNSADAYGPAQLINDVRRGIFSELSSGSVRIDAFRRNLQRSYIALAGTKINPPPPPTGGTGGGQGGGPAAAAAASVPGDVQALFRADLKALDVELRNAAVRASDRTTRAHLEDARERIAKILDPS